MKENNHALTRYANSNSNANMHLSQPKSPKARLIVPIMESSFFSKLCFIMLPNRLLIELVELKD